MLKRKQMVETTGASSSRIRPAPATSLTHQSYSGITQQQSCEPAIFGRLNTVMGEENMATVCETDRVHLTTGFFWCLIQGYAGLQIEQLQLLYSIYVVIRGRFLPQNAVDPLHKDLVQDVLQKLKKTRHYSLGRVPTFEECIKTLLAVIHDIGIWLLEHSLWKK